MDELTGVGKETGISNDRIFKVERIWSIQND